MERTLVLINTLVAAICLRVYRTPALLTRAYKQDSSVLCSSSTAPLLLHTGSGRCRFLLARKLLSLYQAVV